MVCFAPDGILPAAPRIAGIGGWLSWIVVGAAAIWLVWQMRRQIPAGAICAILVVAGSLCSIRAAGANDSWLAHHLLLGCCAIAAFLMLGLGFAATIGHAEGARQHLAPGRLAHRLGWESLHPAVTQWIVMLWGLGLLLTAVETWHAQSTTWWATRGGPPGSSSPAF
jgi:hypothetical protein